MGGQPVAQPLELVERVLGDGAALIVMVDKRPSRPVARVLVTDVDRDVVVLWDVPPEFSTTPL